MDILYRYYIEKYTIPLLIHIIFFIVYSQILNVRECDIRFNIYDYKTYVVHY